MKKFNWAIVITALLGFIIGLIVGWAVWGYNVPLVEAKTEKVNLCHSTSSDKNPWEAIQVSDKDVDTHKGHGDFDYNGPVDDKGKPTKDGDKWCEKNAPEPTPTPTPTPDKFDVQIARPEFTCDTNYIAFGGTYRPDDKRMEVVFIINGRYPEVKFDEGKWTTGELTLAPGNYKIRAELYGGEKLLDSMDGKFTIDECEKPTPTPTPTPTPEVEHHASPPGAPEICPNVPTPEPPANFHLYRKGDQADLRWMPTDGDTVNIYYKNPSAGAWEHSVINSPNDGIEMIGGLGSYDWTFGLAQVNDGCNQSEIVSVEDGNTPGWVLFRP